jgi:hypothetical protein
LQLLAHITTAHAIHKEARGRSATSGSNGDCSIAIAIPVAVGRREAQCIAPKHMMNTDAD